MRKASIQNLHLIGIPHIKLIINDTLFILSSQKRQFFRNLYTFEAYSIFLKIIKLWFGMILGYIRLIQKGVSKNWK